MVLSLIVIRDEQRNWFFDFRCWPRSVRNSQAGFQFDALSSVSDWLIFIKQRFGWLRAPTSQHQFENLAQWSAGIDIVSPILAQNSEAGCQAGNQELEKLKNSHSLARSALKKYLMWNRLQLEPFYPFRMLNRFPLFMCFSDLVVAIGSFG